jgi:hypothetical protein
VFSTPSSLFRTAGSEPLEGSTEQTYRFRAEGRALSAGALPQSLTGEGRFYTSTCCGVQLKCIHPVVPGWWATSPMCAHLSTCGEAHPKHAVRLKSVQVLGLLANQAAPSPFSVCPQISPGLWRARACADTTSRWGSRRPAYEIWGSQPRGRTIFGLCG